MNSYLASFNVTGTKVLKPSHTFTGIVVGDASREETEEERGIGMRVKGSDLFSRPPYC